MSKPLVTQQNRNFASLSCIHLMKYAECIQIGGDKMINN